MTYQIELHGSGGLLDTLECCTNENHITATLAEHLAAGHWGLRDGDIIKIRAIDPDMRFLRIPVPQ